MASTRLDIGGVIVHSVVDVDDHKVAARSWPDFNVVNFVSNQDC